MSNWDILSKLQTVTVATVEAHRPRLRPMTLIHMKKRLFLATGSGDAKVRQLKDNPFVELLILQKSPQGNGYLRISGALRVIDELPLKKAVADYAEFIHDYWQDPADKDYMLYELLPDQWRYLKPGEELEIISS